LKTSEAEPVFPAQLEILKNWIPRNGVRGGYFAAADGLKARSCLIDGEAVACDGDGMPCFDRLRYRRQDGHVFIYAFDLIELDGDDLRRERIERRKVLLIRLLAKAGVGLRANDHTVEPGLRRSYGDCHSQGNPHPIGQRSSADVAIGQRDGRAWQPDIRALG
jgi:hypothetical protein